MDNDQKRLEAIRAELSLFFRRNGKYGLSEPLLYEEIRLLLNKIYDSNLDSIYKKRGLSREDALQDAVLHLLQERGGMAASHIYKVYFEYYERNLEMHLPYTLVQSRKAMKTIMRQGLTKRTNSSIADNVFTRALLLLSKTPYTTHFEKEARRFTFDHQTLQQLDPLPDEASILRAIRFAANVPKIPQVDNPERVNKVFHTPDLHLALQLTLEHAPGLNVSQLHKVVEGLLTDRPTPNVFGYEDMNAIVESNSSLDDLDAETAAVVRQVARDIWNSTDRATKTILSRQFAGMPDQKIALETSFDADDPERRRSRSWVTTKFTDFGGRVSREMAGLSPEDQLRVSRLLEAHITNYDIEVDQ